MHPPLAGDATQSQRQPYTEPIRVTLRRTVGLAAIFGAALAPALGGLSHWPLATLLMLWPTLGGHFVELWFLNRLRPRLAPSRDVQVLARVAVWFVGGVALGFGLVLTAWALGGYRLDQWPPWWLAGPAFIGIELAAQLALQLRGRPSFYNGRG